MSIPEKPKLRHLRGDFVLSTRFRDKLRIPNGILCEEARKWKDCKNLVDSFFQNSESAFAYSYESFIKNHTESLQSIAEAKHKDDREIELLSEFAGRVKAYLLHPAVDKALKKYYDKKIQEWNETTEKEILDHEGRMTALIVAQNQSKGLQESEREKRKQPESTSHLQREEKSSNNNSIRKREFQPEGETSPKKKQLKIEDCQEELLELHFELAEENKRYKLNGFDVSKHFHDFQKSLKSRKLKFHVETHVHHILAISSILLLKPNRMNEDVVKVFGSSNLNLIMNDMNKRLGLNQTGLPMDIIVKVTRIIESVKSKVITRSQAVIDLLIMEKELDKKSFKVIKSIANILAKVPNTTIMETIKENELCSRYLDPLLSGLFDEPENSTFFRWTNERPSEVKDSKGDLSNERPDAVISLLEGVKWTRSQGFGEVKCFDESDNNFLTYMDLVRFGIFNKMSIDAHLVRVY